MRKNVASQTIGAEIVSATDGSAFTGTVDVFVTGDGGTQAAGTQNSGEAVHEGNGYHSYAPSQAETNFDHVAFTFVGTGAVPVTVQVYTSFPQTGDSFVRIGADGAGLTEAGGTGDHLTAIPTANQNADALLDRTAGVETSRTLRQALRIMLAALAGKASGLATPTAVYRDTNDTVDRITATVDENGNRSAVTLNAG